MDGAIQVSDTWHHFDGELVEISGVEELLEPSQETRDEQPDIEPLDVNGLRGRVIGWSEEDQKCIVETFNGLVVGVKGEHLRGFAPEAATEAGGFDVAWPSGPVDPEAVAGEVARLLAQRGWCVIQMFTTDASRKEAALEALDIVDWRLTPKDFEVQCMGHDNTTKYADLDLDDLNKEPENSLGQLDRQLTSLGQLMVPYAEEYLGFTVWGRQPGQVRAKHSQREEIELRPREVTEDDYEPGGRVHAHMDFVERRKMLAMYVVDCQGGDLWLYPTARAADAVSTCIPLSSSKIVVLMPDLMTYSYQPTGDSLLLQSWYMAAPTQSNAAEERIVELPATQLGERVHVTSLEMRYGGACHGAAEGWSMWTMGCDCAYQIPSARFDYSAFYSADGTGLMYTNHFAGVQESLVQSFDYDFFGIPFNEADAMSPGQRNVLEVGYLTMHSAGYDRRRARGMVCGFYIGDAGTDWPCQGAIPKLYAGIGDGTLNPQVYNGWAIGIRASRLSHLMDMKGPCLSVDTACSSSLVALGQAHRSMVVRDKGQLTASADANIDKAIVMGLCLDDGLNTFIAYCQAQMLSTGGRSFTFDESANGFLRGEGCGGAFLQRSRKDEDAQLMLACIIGSNVNQDGRSASMTAPNGPSQQACIRSSMMEAGLTASQISVAECHGTGTALGDPIEVGALRDVMKDRGEDPIIMTSAKANFGHMEACAGIGGITKCILMLNGTVGACNVHLRHINPHIEYTGYPALFVSENVDMGLGAGISGVSSFGVGGTNARGDLWGRSRMGHCKTDGVNTHEGEGLQAARFERLAQSGKLGPAEEDRLFIQGTWDGYSSMTEMTPTAEGAWTALVALGDINAESFQFVLNEDKEQVFYPAGEATDPNAEVCGPDWQGSGKAWRLNARGSGPQTFCIRFSWDFSWETGERKRVEWARYDGPEPPLVDGTECEHHYFILGSWTAWKCIQMRSVNATPGLYEAKVRIGTTGAERFHFMRDRDSEQVLYPRDPKTDRQNSSIRGPDGAGRGKHWVIRGETGEHALVQLRVLPEVTEVKVSSSHGEQTWSG